MSAERVLIVDDEDNVRRTMQIALEAAGYTVVTAADGEAGVERFRADARPDLVICDERMPGIDGLETIRRLRQIDRSVPILLATAYGTLDIVSHALRDGASGFLEKPFTPGSLRAVVAEILVRDRPKEGFR